MPELKEYCNIYLYIKNNNSTLFKLIEDTCTEHIFKFRFITFLMPNTALINKIKKEKPSIASEMIKGLVFKGLYEKPEDMKDNVFNMLNKKVIDPSKLKVKVDKKFIQWEGRNSLSVFTYDESDIPKYSEEEVKPKKTKKTIKVKK